MVISKDKFVEIDFVIKGTDGQLYDDTSKHPQSPTFLFGQGMMFPGIEEALEGKKSGEKFSVEIAPDKAFGPRRDDMIQKTTIDEFGGADVQPGLRFQTQTPQGPMIVTVTEVNGPEVVLDLNHPLAGKDLVFDITVKTVREATEAELNPSAGHCCNDDNCSNH